MGIGDILGRFARPSGKTLEAPIRAIVHEVLKEQGYASPAEVQSLRDEGRQLRARLDKIESRIEELVKLLEASRAVASAPVVPDERIPALTAEVARLSALLATVPAAPASAAASPLSAEPRGECRVADCGQLVRSKGFCSAHYQQWRRGTLKGFVGQDGLAEVEGRIVHLPPDHAGGAVTVDGRRVLVDGHVVSEIAAG